MQGCWITCRYRMFWLVWSVPIIVVIRPLIRETTLPRLMENWVGKWDKHFFLLSCICRKRLGKVIKKSYLWSLLRLTKSGWDVNIYLSIVKKRRYKLWCILITWIYWDSLNFVKSSWMFFLVHDNVKKT